MPNHRSRTDRFWSLAKRLERDQGEGVLHAGNRLDLAGDEVPDVDLLVEIALHRKVVLA